jgi:hypothetical protein
VDALHLLSPSSSPNEHRNTATALDRRRLLVLTAAKPLQDAADLGESLHRCTFSSSSYTLDKSRSHTSDGSNHTPITKTTRLWINLKS